MEVSESIHVDAPVERVFEYMDQPGNQPEITPSLSRSEHLDDLDNGGKRVAYTYSMAGIGLSGEITATDYRPGERIEWAMTGDLEGTITWTFASTEGGTEVTYAADFDVPVPVGESVVDPLVARYNSRELRTTLENLKTRLEAETT
jgi:uncharacterized membrane protein